MAEAHQVPLERNLQNASGGGGASVSDTLMYAGTGAVLQIGHLYGPIDMVGELIVTDIQATEDPLGATGVRQEEELLQDTEEGEVGAAVAVYLIVQYVTAVATAVALFAADHLWIDTVDRHVWRGGVHLLGVGADQNHSHLLPHNLQSGLAKRSQGRPLRVPQEGQALFRMVMALLTQVGINIISWRLRLLGGLMRLAQLELSWCLGMMEDC